MHTRSALPSRRNKDGISTAFSCVDTKSVFDPVKTVSNCIKPYQKRPTERLSAEKNRKPPKGSRPPQRLSNSLIHNANACISAKKEDLWVFLSWAASGTRTHDLFVTNEMLYQLSYCGLYGRRRVSLSIAVAKLVIFFESSSILSHFFEKKREPAPFAARILLY